MTKKNFQKERLSKITFTLNGKTSEYALNEDGTIKDKTSLKRAKRTNYGGKNKYYIVNESPNHPENVHLSCYPLNHSPENVHLSGYTPNGYLEYIHPNDARYYQLEDELNNNSLNESDISILSQSEGELFSSTLSLSGNEPMNFSENISTEGNLNYEDFSNIDLPFTF